MKNNTKKRQPSEWSREGCHGCSYKKNLIFTMNSQCYSNGVAVECSKFRACYH